MKIKYKTTKKYKHTNGFTLVEALVAISILMIAVTGPMVVAQKGLISAISSKDQMIAAFLAQDAIEYIKNVRDSNGVKANALGETLPDEWLSGLGGMECINGTPDLVCNVDTLHNGLLSSNVSPQMCIERSVGGQFLGYGVGDSSTCVSSKFFRYIKIKRVNDETTGKPADEAYIDVLIKWGTGADQQFRIGSYVYNYWGNL
jgi:hypothetical protein